MAQSVKSTMPEIRHGTLASQRLIERGIFSFFVDDLAFFWLRGGSSQNTSRTAWVCLAMWKVPAVILLAVAATTQGHVLTGRAVIPVVGIDHAKAPSAGQVTLMTAPPFAHTNHAKARNTRTVTPVTAPPRAHVLCSDISPLRAMLDTSPLGVLAIIIVSGAIFSFRSGTNYRGYDGDNYRGYDTRTRTGRRYDEPYPYEEYDKLRYDESYPYYEGNDRDNYRGYDTRTRSRRTYDEPYPYDEDYSPQSYDDLDDARYSRDRPTYDRYDKHYMSRDTNLLPPS